MKAIIALDNTSIKYLLPDTAVVAVNDDCITVTGTSETEEFTIGDLNSTNAKVIENFPPVPDDFAPDAYLYEEATQTFTLNPDYYRYEELLAVQQGG